jgi:hypothetical protein
MNAYRALVMMMLTSIRAPAGGSAAVEVDAADAVVLLSLLVLGACSHVSSAGTRCRPGVCRAVRSHAVDWCRL